jgi:hypothetical protein
MPQLPKLLAKSEKLPVAPPLAVVQTLSDLTYSPFPDIARAIPKLRDVRLHTAAQEAVEETAESAMPPATSVVGANLRPLPCQDAAGVDGSVSRRHRVRDDVTSWRYLGDPSVTTRERKVVLGVSEADFRIEVDVSTMKKGPCATVRYVNREGNPRKHADVRAWFRCAHTFLLSELADYELRRQLLRIGAVRSIAPLRAPRS